MRTLLRESLLCALGALIVAACGASLTSAQDVVYVDDYTSPARRQAGPSLPTLSKAAGQPTRSMPSSTQHGVRRSSSQPALTRQQVAQVLSAQAQQKMKEQEKPSRFGKLTSGFKSLFIRDKSEPTKSTPPSYAQQPSQRQSQRQGLTQAIYTPRDSRSSVVQASAAKSLTGSKNPRGSQINVRRGDQRVGLFDMAWGGKSKSASNKSASNKSSSNKSSSKRITGAKPNTRKPTMYKAPSPAPQVASRSQAPLPKRSAPQPLVVNNPLPAKPLATAAKPSDGIVFVTDLEETPNQTPAKRKVQLTLNPPQEVVAKTAPKPEMTPKPMVVTSPSPLVIENSKAIGPQPVEKLAEVVKPKAEPMPAKLAPASVMPKKLAKAPQPMPMQPKQVLPQATQSKLALPKPTQPVVTVLPNPVQQAEQQPSQPTERAASLLAEAHVMAQTAQSEQEFTRVVQQCRHVLAIDDSPMAVQYSNDLAAWALNKRGELKADEGRDGDAMADFDDAVRKDASRWRAIHNRGVLLAQSGKFADAFDAFNKTVELNPKHAKAYSNRASLYVQAGEFQIALADYKRAIALDPDLVIAHKGRGRVCHVTGQMEQALRHFEAAVLLDPRDATVATCRADLLMDMGYYSQAMEGYRKAIAIDPEMPTAYRNLAWLQATCPKDVYRDGQEALANANKAMELTATADDICLDTLAAAQAAAGDYPSAIDTIKQAIDLAPASDQAEYAARMELYQASRPFLSTPSGVRQAGYTQAKEMK